MGGESIRESTIPDTVRGLGGQASDRDWLTAPDDDARGLIFKRCLIPPVVAWRLSPFLFFLLLFIFPPFPRAKFLIFQQHSPFLSSITVTIQSQSQQAFQSQDPVQNGLLSASPATNPSFSTENDTIDPHRTSSTDLPSIITTPSESPISGSLNFSIASRSSSSLPNAFTTFDFTSFTTDNNQQPWLPTPPPQQPLAQNPDSSNNDKNSNNNNGPSSLQEDFVLYPSLCPQTQSRDLRASAHLSTAPRLSAYPRPLVQSRHPARRHSVSLQQHHQQQLAGSPVQVPRVTRLASQSTGYPLSSTLRSSPSNRKHLLRLFAASNSAPVAPNSKYYYRPPVPLFNNSTANSPTQIQYAHSINHRRIMSTPNMAQDLFDFASDSFGDEFAHLTEPTMLSPHLIPTGIMATKDPVGEVPCGTISPKDLMMDASAPPSTAFTELSTPSFDSPGYFSQDTSPMFGTDLDLAPGHEEWDSLFPPQDGLSIPFDPEALEIAASVSQIKVEGPNSPAVKPTSSPMVKSTSASSSPSTRGSSTKHSAVAGVNARQRKPLPPIKVDKNDPVAVKRARNTEAARKSRARKLERQGEMERRIAELEKALEQAQQREEYWKAIAQSRAGAV